MQLTIGSDFDWLLILTVVSIASMVVGNFQLSGKKMLKDVGLLFYCACGFLLVGVIAQSETGNEAMLFYALIYALMNYAAFG